MFKVVFWPFKVNAAIAGFGIPPTKLNGDFRSEVQLLGMNAGLTAQETALILLSLKIGIHYDDEFESILAALIRDGKVDTSKLEVIDALHEMGYSVDAPWEYDAILVFTGDISGDGLDEVDAYTKSPIAQLFARFRWSRIKDHAV